MKYVGLNNKDYKINTTKYIQTPTNKSKLHLKVLQFLKSYFCLYSILQEVPLKGCSKGTLYCDFIIPQPKLVIECQGRQHEVHTPFFHSKSEFLKAKQRDILKQQWCDLNNFRLINFNYNETELEWSKKLNE